MSELTQHEQIVQAFNNYLVEHEAWESKSVKAAATRARGALGDLSKNAKIICEVMSYVGILV
jgi:hypothetical protein